MADYYEGWDDDFDCHYSISVTPKEVNYENDDGTSVHQIYIDVKYVFNVPPGGKFPIAQTAGEELVPFGKRWILQNVPRGLSGLRPEVVGVLDSASIPSAAKENTVRMIFGDFLGREYRRRASAYERQIVGMYTVAEVVTEAEDPKSEEEDEDPMEEDEDEDPIQVDEDEDPIEEEGVVMDEEEIFRYYYYEDSNVVEVGDGDEDEEYGRAVEESMEEGFLYVKARPAKREAVEALERVRVWGEERETGCAVCMDEFSFEVQATKMPCSHVFHTDCLITWLDRQCFCPLCKFELPSEEAEEEDGYVLM